MNGTTSNIETDLGGLRVERRRRVLIRALTASALSFGLIAGILALPASAAPGALAGTWTSEDLDGSNQSLELRGAGNPGYAAFLRDDFTSGVCGGPPAKLVGPAVADGDVLVVRGTLVCLPGGNPIPGVRVFLTFQYDAGTDTLTDDAGVVWERAS